MQHKPWEIAHMRAEQNHAMPLTQGFVEMIEPFGLYLTQQPLGVSRLHSNLV
jgi:hypothetical protein